MHYLLYSFKLRKRDNHYGKRIEWYIDEIIKSIQDDLVVASMMEGESKELRINIVLENTDLLFHLLAAIDYETYISLRQESYRIGVSDYVGDFRKTVLKGD